jgi:hypothetical protein
MLHSQERHVRNHSNQKCSYVGILVWMEVLLLAASVINFAEKVLFFIVVLVLLQPQSQDEPVTKEQHSEKTRIINTEPLICSLSRNGSRRGKNGRHDSSNGSHNSLAHLWGLHCHGKSRRALGDAKGCRGGCRGKGGGGRQKRKEGKDSLHHGQY